jgi:hypothetical protein
MACYSNRSACYLKLCMYEECRVDCNTAVRLMTGKDDTKTNNENSNSNSNNNNNADNGGITTAKSGSSAGLMGTGFSDIATSTHQLNKMYFRRGTASCQLGRHTSPSHRYCGDILMYYYYYYHYDDDDGDDDGGGDDEYTNLFLSASCSFYSYIPHFPSPSASFIISLYIIIITF